MNSHFPTKDYKSTRDAKATTGAKRVKTRSGSMPSSSKQKRKSSLKSVSTAKKSRKDGDSIVISDSNSEENIIDKDKGMDVLSSGKFYEIFLKMNSSYLLS